MVFWIVGFWFWGCWIVGLLDCWIVGVILVVRLKSDGFLLMGSVQVQAARLKKPRGWVCITNQHCISEQLYDLTG